MVCLFGMQAQQEIPEWLEALAADSRGYGGFTANANQFKDSRRGNVGISFGFDLYIFVSNCFISSC